MPVYLYADSDMINYSLKLSDEFLLGNDSINVVIQNGKHMTKLKLIKGARMEVGMSHFIPCFSGRNLTEQKKIQEIAEWNGISYTFYYPDQNRCIVIQSVVSNFKNLKKGSKFELELVQIEQNELDRNNFKKLYLKFVTIEAMIKTKGIEYTAKHPYHSKQLEYDYLNKIDLKGYSVSEIESLFRLKISDNEIYEFNLYYNGSSIRVIKIEIENGVFQSIDY